MKRKARSNALQENIRQEALRKLAILDTPQDEFFDIFPQMAMSMLGMPTAGIGFLDCNRIWFKSVFGMPSDFPNEIPKDLSFCRHAIESSDGILVVEDAIEDSRFASNPFVGGEHGLRFYAGATFATSDGIPLGTICVADKKPRQVDAAFVSNLRRMAKAVSMAVAIHGLAVDEKKRERTDALTGLLKPEVFMEDAVGLARDGDVTLFFVNVEGMDELNRLLGRTVGNSVLEEAGRRMTTWAASRKTVCGRIGGDEFVAVVPGPGSSSRSRRLGKSLARALSGSLIPFGRTDSVRLVTSVGMATSIWHGTDVEGMVRSAEASMVVARRDGNYVGKVRGGRRELAGKREATAMLKEAFLPDGKKPFRLDYQPSFNLRDGSLHGFEALVRWQPEDGRILPPSCFIPVAEANGSIVQLDSWCLDRACEDAASWEGNIPVSVNVSAASFLSGSIENRVRDALARTGLAPHRLKIEITETALLPSKERSHAAITALQSMGVKILLDDFGCGHASFGYLLEYSFDGIKIDKAFIQGAEDGGKTLVLLRTLCGLTSLMGIETVAEGVETERQLEAVRSEGIEVVQGFFTGRPQTYPAAKELASHWA